jgi:hypothetical protein
VEHRVGEEIRRRRFQALRDLGPDEPNVLVVRLRWCVWWMYDAAWMRRRRRSGATDQRRAHHERNLVGEDTRAARPASHADERGE